MRRQPPCERHVFRAVGAPSGPRSSLVSEQDLQPLEVAGPANQTPFASHGPQTAERKLPKPQGFLDDAKHGFHGAFAPAVNGLAEFGAQLVGHLDHRAGIGRRRCGLLGEGLPPVLAVRLAAGREVGLDVARFQARDVGGAVETVVARRGLGTTHGGRDRIQGGQRFFLSLGWLVTRLPTTSRVA